MFVKTKQKKVSSTQPSLHPLSLNHLSYILTVSFTFNIAVEDFPVALNVPCQSQHEFGFGFPNTIPHALATFLYSSSAAYPHFCLLIYHFLHGDLIVNSLFSQNNLLIYLLILQDYSICASFICLLKLDFCKEFQKLINNILVRIIESFMLEKTCKSMKSNSYRITESQNVRGWKGPLWVI